MSLQLNNNVVKLQEIFLYIFNSQKYSLDLIFNQNLLSNFKIKNEIVYNCLKSNY